MSEAVNYSVTIYPKNKKETEDFKKTIDELRHELDEDPEISEYPSYGTKTPTITADWHGSRGRTPEETVREDLKSFIEKHPKTEIEVRACFIEQYPCDDFTLKGVCKKSPEKCLEEWSARAVIR